MPWHLTPGLPDPGLMRGQGSSGPSPWDGATAAQAYTAAKSSFWTASPMKAMSCAASTSRPALKNGHIRTVRRDGTPILGHGPCQQSMQISYGLSAPLAIFIVSAARLMHRSGAMTFSPLLTLRNPGGASLSLHYSMVIWSLWRRRVRRPVWWPLTRQPENVAGPPADSQACPAMCPPSV